MDIFEFCHDPSFWAEVDSWYPSNEDDIIVKQTRNALILPVSKFYGLENNSMVLDNFILTPKRCYNSMEVRRHMCRYLNYFEKFYDKEHEFVMNKDINENLELMEKKKYTLKIEPNPSDAIVTIYKNNSVLKTGIGILEVTVLDEDELKYTVSKYGYNEINDTVKIGKDENIQINLTEIEEKTIDSDE